MRIAIVGGGAAGVASAWMLDLAHEVTLFEAGPVLGGHVRTLGLNVPCPALPEGVRLDCGVVEFCPRHFPTFTRLMQALEVPLEPFGGGETALYRADGRHLLSPGAIHDGEEDPVERLREYAHLVPPLLRLRRFKRLTAALGPRALSGLSVGRLLEDGDFSTWVKALLMYAYSTEYPEVDALPAALAVPMLRDFLRINHWCRVPGGVYRWIERASSGLRGQVRVGAPVRAITRQAEGVTLRLDEGEARFDAVVIATPPDRVLSLLGDADEAERRRFSAWRGEEVTTVVHRDTGLYERRGVAHFSEFDLFERPDGGFGYNAYLNRIAGLPDDRPPHYSLAFQLDGELDPAKVLHRQRHHVPGYSVEALRPRAEVLRHQGARRTWYAGAWLGDGLHEGAIASAARVSAALGGRLP